MAFHVFPDPQTALQRVAPGEATPTSVIDTGATGEIGIDDDGSEAGVIPSRHEATVFVRYSMKGAVPPEPAKWPSLIIQVNEGPQAEVKTLYPDFTSLNDGVNPTDAASATGFNPDSKTMFLVKVWIHIPNILLKIRIRNNDETSHDFAWVIGSNQAATRQQLKTSLSSRKKPGPPSSEPEPAGSSGRRRVKRE